MSNDTNDTLDSIKITLESNWKQLTGSVKEMWGELTDDEITQIDGSREKLAGRIQERYGKAKDEVEQEIDAWTEKNKHTW